MVFDENSSCDWESKEKEKTLALELDDNEDTQDDGDRLNEDGSENEGTETSMENVQRSRRRPLWMADYTSGEELSDEDTLAHLVLFAGSDLITFDEAIKSEKWGKAMDAEIEAIERNNTWKLVKLPEEKNQ